VRRFVLFAIALIAIAVVLQTLIQPRNVNSGRTARFQYKERPPVSVTATAAMPPSQAVTTLPAPARD
jgi:hypothetical protein